LYRRRGTLVGVALVVVLTITVITDLPSPASRSTNIASAATVIQQVNSDMSPCVFSVNEAFTIYGDQTRDAVTAADRARVPALLQEDQAACSFTNQSIFSLSDIDVPGSASGKQLANIVNSVTLWATSDALGAIDAIQTLSTDPTNTRALGALVKYKSMLEADRGAAETSLRSIDTMLDAHIVALDLPEVPAPTSSSSAASSSS
jgi:hypothetical protein